MQGVPSLKLPNSAELFVTKSLPCAYPPWDSKNVPSYGDISHLPLIIIWFWIVLTYFRVRNGLAVLKKYSLYK